MSQLAYPLIGASFTPAMVTARNALEVRGEAS